MLTEVKNISVIQNILMNCDILPECPDEKHELVEQLQKLIIQLDFVVMVQMTVGH